MINKRLLPDNVISVPPFGATLAGLTLAIVGKISILVTASAYFANPISLTRTSGFQEPPSKIAAEFKVSKSQVITRLL
jgi:hypothetical protein